MNRESMNREIKRSQILSNVARETLEIIARLEAATNLEEIESLRKIAQDLRREFDRAMR